jgi:Domain of unknown function (DUF5060)
MESYGNGTRLLCALQDPKRQKRQLLPTPFTDYCLDVTFTHNNSDNNNKKHVIVPGYYAADGNAANTHATSGNVWLVHFTPDLMGRWDREASICLWS